MGLFFKKLGAQLNPFDHGQTWSTVARGAQPTPAPQRPASAFNQPSRQVSFGANNQFVGTPKSGPSPVVSKPSVAWNTQTQKVVLPQINNNVQVGVPQPIPQLGNRQITQSKPTNQMTAADYAKDPAGRFFDSVGLGIGRSLTGTAQNVAGLYDAVTPGLGQNHITQQLNKNAESQDARIKAQGLNNAAYHTAQVGTDIATFLLPGATSSKLVIKGADVASKVPGATKAAVKLAEGADKIAKTGKTGKAAVTTAKYLTKPGVVANTLTDTALGTGYRSARGQDISPGTILQDYGMSAGTQGALTGAGKAIKYSATAARDQSKYIDNVIKNYSNTKFGQAVTNTMASRQAAQDAVDAQHAQGMQSIKNAEDAVARAKQAAAEHKAAMGTLDETQARIKAEQAAREAAVAEQLAAPHQKLLTEGNGGHFTVNRLEDERIGAGLAKLSKEYDAEVKAVNKQYPTELSRNSKTYQDHMNALEDEFARRNADLQNGVGEFAVQPTQGSPAMPQNKPQKASANRPQQAADLKTLNSKIKNVKDPARKAELIAERDNLLAQQKPKVTQKVPEQTLKDAAKATEPYVYASKRKGVSTLNRAWQTVAGVIDQYGAVGKDIAKRLHAQRDAAEITKQEFYSQIPTVMGLDSHDMRFFAQGLDTLSKGGVLDPSTPPHIQQAIAEWNKAIPSIRDKGIAAGLDIGDLGENYFPRMYKDLNSQKGKDRLIESIRADAAAKGKPMSSSEASMIVDKIREGSAKTYGNLEKTRQYDAPGYEMTHDAIIEYTNRALDRITKAEQFGPNNEYLNQAFQDLKDQGYSPDHIDKVFEKYVNIALGNIDHNTTGHKISSAIRKFNAVTSLSAAGISNSTQSTNTAAVGGIGRTVKAIVNQIGGGAWGAEARAAAEKSGVALDHSIADITQQQLGTNGMIARNIASPFFHKIEKFNRQVSAMVGADYGDHLAAKGDYATLRDKFGITGDIGETLTNAQKTQMARKMVEISQFKVDPMDLPGWADSALGKLAMQFRTFGYKQTEFVYNQVVREAMKGNMAPLARFIAVGVPAGIASNEVRAQIQGKAGSLLAEKVTGKKDTQPEDTTPKSQQTLGKIGMGLAQVGGFGLPGTAYSAANRAKDSKDPVSIVAGTVGGPTAGLAIETGKNINTAKNGGWKPLIRETVRKTPAVGPTIASLAMPYDASKAPAKAGTTPKADATPAELDKQAKADLEKLKTNAKAEGYSIEQLVNGKYAYTIKGEVKTADTLKKANEAVAKDAFGDSDQNVKVIGDTVYRKNAAGDVSTMTKTKYDYSIGTQELEKYKRADDMNGWMKTANKQLDSIDKQLKDPNIDPLDAISLQNDAEALMEKMAKYGGQGGFTKGSGGSAMANPYKYAVNTSSGGGKPAIVRAKGAAKVGIAKQVATSTGKPRVSLKKSLV